MSNKSPFVYVVGAGPGDVELLTRKAYRLITEEADVVVYDRLIPEEIIELIPEGVLRVYAGKSCRKHVMTQDEINDVLVEEAKKGQVVVRLKGGDPFIFGRGGEEILHLMDNGIEFEVVPGVSAADGCAAYQGIPLTHRGVATGVRFITGHQQKGEAADLDWQGLAWEDTTIVIYMGLANLGFICGKLVEHGLPADVPVAVIQEGTTKNERVLVSNLGEVAGEVEVQGFKPPVIVIIGKVVGLRRA